jgi:hypothetical protein
VGACGCGATSPVGGMGGGVGGGVAGSTDASGAPGSPSKTNSTVAGGGSPSFCRS